MQQIFRNLAAVLVEFGLIGAVALMAWRAPWWLAGLSAIMIVVAGCAFERSRQRHELPFYFDTVRGIRLVVATAIGIGESLIKALAAAAAVILTFAGGDGGRGFVLALVLAMCLVIGVGILRRGYHGYAMRPGRWGSYRLAVPLGVLFSLGVQASVALGLVIVPSMSALAKDLVFDVPARPGIAQLSDLAFNVRQLLDAMIVDVGARVVGEPFAAVLAVVVSINVLIGFALAILSVAIVEIGLRIEGGRGRRRRAGEGDDRARPSKSQLD